MEPERPPLLIPSEIGSIRLRLSEDILHVHSDGYLDVATTKQLIVVYQSVIDHFGYFLMRMDMSKSTGIDLEARRCAVDWGKDWLDVHATAATGASLIVRMFVGLMFRASQLLAKNTTSTMYFASDEASAISWLMEQRPRLQAAAAARLTKRP